MTEASSIQNEIPKAYEPGRVEARWYQFWLEKGYFMPEVDPVGFRGSSPGGELSGRNSVVEYQLPKLGVVGSNPIARSSLRRVPAKMILELS